METFIVDKHTCMSMILAVAPFHPLVSMRPCTASIMPGEMSPQVSCSRCLAASGSVP